MSTSRQNHTLPLGEGSGRLIGHLRVSASERLRLMLGSAPIFVMPGAEVWLLSRNCRVLYMCFSYKYLYGPIS